MNLSPRASRQIEAQRVRYLQSLSEKKLRIERAWNEAQRQAWSKASFDHFKTLVHRLAGSAGSYGLDKLGRAAKCLDHLMGSIPADEPPAGRVKALKDELLTRLDEAIETHQT
ncbi:MAG: hypothetical protein HKN15_03540 [Xanthomonadales bacterium]|nr:hypothetical protein [Xanthomonadales bacterium]